MAWAGWTPRCPSPGLRSDVVASTIFLVSQGSSWHDWQRRSMASKRVADDTLSGLGISSETEQRRNLFSYCSMSINYTT